MNPIKRKVLKIKTGEILHLSDFVISRLKKDGHWKDLDLIPEMEIPKKSIQEPKIEEAKIDDQFPSIDSIEDPEKPKKKKKSDENQEL